MPDPNLLLLAELLELSEQFWGENREMILETASRVWDLVMGS